MWQTNQRKDLPLWLYVHRLQGFQAFALCNSLNCKCSPNSVWTILLRMFGKFSNQKLSPKSEQPSEIKNQQNLSKIAVTCSDRRPFLYVISLTILEKKNTSKQPVHYLFINWSKWFWTMAEDSGWWRLMNLLNVSQYVSTQHSCFPWVRLTWCQVELGWDAVYVLLSCCSARLQYPEPCHLTETWKWL